MKIIALEEHFQNAAIEEAVGRLLPAHQRDSAGKSAGNGLQNDTNFSHRILGFTLLKPFDANKVYHNDKNSHKATRALSEAFCASVSPVTPGMFIRPPVDTTTGTCALSPVHSRHLAAGDTFRSASPLTGEC